jgi:hypothetical protein
MLDMGTYGDLGGMMVEARAASFLPDDCSTYSPGLFLEEIQVKNKNITLSHYPKIATL